MGIDFNYYRRMNEMLDVPENNGTPENSEIIERMSKILVDTNEKIVHSFDLYKRQGLLTDAIRRRHRSYDHIDVHVYYRKIKEPTLNSLARGIYADLNTLKTGDYITYTDKYSGNEETYMIRSKPEPKRTYEDAYMLFCNDNLRWVDRNTKEVVSYPCVVSHDKYIIDNADEGFFDREGSWVVVFIQANKDTLKIETGYRFLFREENDTLTSAYEVIDTNPHALRGMIFVKIKKVKVVENVDNLDILVADYKKYITNETPVVDNSEIIGGMQILLGDTNEYKMTDGFDFTNYEWRIDSGSNLSVNKYLTYVVDDNNVLHVNAIASVPSVGNKFYVSIFNKDTDTVYLNKEVEVTGW